MVDGTRRLAQAIGAKGQKGATPFRSATVVSVDTTAGTADIDIIADDGSAVRVQSVKYHSGITPQVGRQVTFLMNGSEPFIISETGSDHDPIFAGRVQAESFLAAQGANLLAPLAAAGNPWTGWTTEGGTLSVNADGHLIVDLPLTTEMTLRSPRIPITRTGRHYTGYVTMPDNVDASPDPGINSRCWVEIVAYNSSGEVVTSWGEWVDAVRLPGENLARYPMGTANAVLDTSVVSAEIIVHAAAYSAGPVEIIDAYFGTAPVFEGGALLAGRTVIDQSSFVLDGVHLLTPWTETEYTNRSSLGGGTWTVRQRRIGKLMAIQCVGAFSNGAYAFGPPTDLVIPGPAVSVSTFAGYMVDTSAAYYYPVVAHIIAGNIQLRRIIHSTGGNGIVTATTPFALTTGDFVYLSGTYEVD